MPYCGLITLLLLVKILPADFYPLPYKLTLQEESTTDDSLFSTSSPETPQGIFHHSENDNTFESKFKIPDFERLDPIRMASELMSAAAAAENKRKTISGINLPLPFAGRPLKFEMARESRSGLSLRDQRNKSEGTETGVNPEATEAFARAKQICIHSSQGSCDEALDTFHRIKFGSSLMIPPPSHRLSFNDDLTTSFAKMFVPAIEEKLDDLEKDIINDVPTEDLPISNQEENYEGYLSDPRRHHKEDDPPRRNRHPFSNVHYPFTEHRSSTQKIQDFLERTS